MADIDALTAHLAEVHGFMTKSIFVFEDDVVLVRDGEDRRWVARVFDATRPQTRVEGDVEILRWLAVQGYPAERPACEDPVSVLNGQAVLVTEAVRAVPRSRRRQTIKDAGGIRGLGELLGRLNALKTSAPAARRPGGAWHHMADGAPSVELAVASDWLTEARERAGVRELRHLDVLADALESVDDCSDLPEAFIHPDCVLANVVASEQDGMVLVDWAGAGTGPRVWSLAFLLWAEGAKNLRRVELAVDGYRRHVSLEPDELDRLVNVIPARPLIFDIWRLHHRSRAAMDAAESSMRHLHLAEAIARQARDAFRS